MKKVNLFFLILILLPVKVLSFNFPQISLLDVTSIKTKEAVLNASIDNLGDATQVEWWFEYDRNNQNLLLKTPITKDTTVKKVSKTITDLLPNANYYYRFCEKDTNNISCTNIKTFSTFMEPEAQIFNAGSITDVSAVLNGGLSSLGTGGNNSVDYWFEYGLGLEYGGKKSTTVKKITTLGAIAENISSLKANSLYYYKFCVRNSLTTICSSNVSFKTSSATSSSGGDNNFISPTVITKTFTETSANSVNLIGKLNNLGSLKTLNYYFEYGENINFGKILNENKNVTSISEFSLELKNLEYEKTYYFKACVRDVVNTSNPVSCGDISFFTLYDYKNKSLGVKSSLISNLTDVSVRLNAGLTGFGGRDEVITWFKYSDGETEKDSNKIRLSGVIRNFSLVLDGLIPGKEYKFMSCVSNTSNIYCEDKWTNFLTLKNITLKESTVENISSTSATLVGIIFNAGISSDNVINGWFEYSTKDDLSANLKKTEKKTISSISLKESIGGLTKKTKYYFKFCAENGLQPVCSSVISFTAVDQLANPLLSLSNFKKLSDSSIRISGKIDSLGGDDIVYVYAEWGDLEKMEKTKETNFKTTTNFDITLDKLIEGKEYFYKICLRNSFSTKCTENKTFKLLKTFQDTPVEVILERIPNIDENFSKKMSGRILLQVEGNGEAWYVNPVNLNRYYLSTPEDAFNVMKKLGLGVTNYTYKLFNVTKNPKLSGRIIINTEDSGKAYYINPIDLQMYYLGTPDDAFKVMRSLSLGISDFNLSKISIYDLKSIEINMDSDSDKITDNIEINKYKTNPFNKDSDLDSYDDFTEINNGFNPNGSGKIKSN